MITITKAIETLDSTASEMGRPEDPDLWDALSLGIEALKHIKTHRLYITQPDFIPLPGEKKE